MSATIRTPLYQFCSEASAKVTENPRPLFNVPPKQATHNESRHLRVIQSKRVECQEATEELELLYQSIQDQGRLWAEYRNNATPEERKADEARVSEFEASYKVGTLNTELRKYIKELKKRLRELDDDIFDQQVKANTEAMGNA